MTVRSTPHRPPAAHNVVAAGATVGLQGREGEILRATLRVTFAYAAAGGMLALWLVA